MIIAKDKRQLEIEGTGTRFNLIHFALELEIIISDSGTFFFCASLEFAAVVVLQPISFAPALRAVEMLTVHSSRPASELLGFTINYILIQ